ncbi:MFS transporter [Burkholderia contaminans]|nr:MFS transporter [Burkholderia contaminans]
METERLFDTESRALGEQMPIGLTLLLATTCALVAASIYYVQPLVGPIGRALGLSRQVEGLVVTMTQVGYGISLLLIAPLADVLENRRLIVGALVASALALGSAAIAQNAISFLVAMFFIGLSAVASQIVVPFTSHLVAESIRGRVVGNVVSGLMLGIMLSRPAASFLTDMGSWRIVFAVSGIGMVVLASVVTLRLPQRFPVSDMSYTGLLASMMRLLVESPLLRRRAIYHALLFGAFSLFWTAVPLYLASPAFQLTQTGIAWFALAGVAGAVAAPVAGRLADRGRTRSTTAVAMIIVAVAFLLAQLSTGRSAVHLAILVLAVIALDFGVSMNLVVGQRVIFALAPQHRSRLNGLYIAIFFLGGAVGSAAGVWCFAHDGWYLTSRTGFALPLLALIFLATEK